MIMNIEILIKLMTVTYGIRDDKFDSEGRVITLEYEKYITMLVTAAELLMCVSATGANLQVLRN